MKTLKQQQGYHHLETDEEVVARLRREGTLWKMRARFDEPFDTWLESHGQSRKLIYVP